MHVDDLNVLDQTYQPAVAEYFLFRTKNRKKFSKMQTGMACLTQDASNVDNVRFWHKADMLTELEVRYERKSDIVMNLNNDYLLILAKKAVNLDQ